MHNEINISANCKIVSNIGDAEVSEKLDNIRFTTNWC